MKYSASLAERVGSPVQRDVDGTRRRKREVVAHGMGRLGVPGAQQIPTRTCDFDLLGNRSRSSSVIERQGSDHLAISDHLEVVERNDRSQGGAHFELVRACRKLDRIADLLAPKREAQQRARSLRTFCRPRAPRGIGGGRAARASSHRPGSTRLGRATTRSWSWRRCPLRSEFGTHS